jgi:hypothetical protein
LLALLRMGPSTKSEVLEEMKLNPTVFLRSTLPPLVDAGLVEQKVEHRGIRKTETHVLSLTLFGRRVAEKLSDIDELVRQASKHAEATNR